MLLPERFRDRAICLFLRLGGNLRPLIVWPRRSSDAISLSIVHTLLSSPSFGCIQTLEVVARSVRHTVMPSQAQQTAVRNDQNYKCDAMPKNRMKSRARSSCTPAPKSRAALHDRMESKQGSSFSTNNWRFNGCIRKHNMSMTAPQKQEYLQFKCVCVQVKRKQHGPA